MECLICHEDFRHLGCHLYPAHEIRARAYKERFNLHLDRGLVSPDLRDKLLARRLEGNLGDRLGKGVPPEGALRGSRTRKPASWRDGLRVTSRRPVKLTTDKVLAIRQAVSRAPLAPDGRLARGSLARIAADYGVSVSTIHQIRRGETWGHA